MRATLGTAGLFVAAGLADLPIVHRILAADGSSPPATLAFGFLSIGLAWAGGWVIQRRWRLLALAIGAAGAAQLLLGAFPLGGDVTAGATAWLLGSGLLSALALVGAARLDFPLGRGG